MTYAGRSQSRTASYRVWHGTREEWADGFTRKGYAADTRPLGGLGAAPLLRSDPFALAECYYSDDHYRTFRRIKEASE